MANLDFITDRLATGGDLPYGAEEKMRDLDEWRELRITHVVDSRLEWSDEQFVATRAPEIRYLHIGVDDAGQRMPDTWFDDGVAFIQEALADPASRVLVHCHMGINRGPSLAYAALLAEGWDAVEAAEAIRTARPFVGLGYARDALDWHHRRQGTPPTRRHSDRRRLAEWLVENLLDTAAVIRKIRDAEAS